MHAKLTRDRKKSFIATLEKTIHHLESDCARLKKILSSVSSSVVTPAASPELSAVPDPDETVDDGGPGKRPRHGFLLDT